MKMNLVEVEVDGAIAQLRLNRPERMNAFDWGLTRALEARFTELEHTESVRVAIFTGAGDRAFSVGGDIAALREMDMRSGREFVELGQRVLGRIERSRLISIAAVHGYALGGGAELALACDLRVGSTDAVFGLPEVAIGMYPGWGGTQRIIRAVGPAYGKYLVLSGAHIEAAEAARVGIFLDVVPPALLVSRAREVAASIAANAPVAVSQAKLAMVHGSDLPLDAALRLEVEAWMVNLSTDDHVEGLAAFLERREPAWQGR